MERLVIKKSEINPELKKRVDSFLHKKADLYSSEELKELYKSYKIDYTSYQKRPVNKVELGKRTIGGNYTTRSSEHGTLYKLDLPENVTWVRGVSSERGAPVLLDGEINNQVGSFFPQENNSGEIRFSRSRNGQEAKSAFARGELSAHIANMPSKSESVALALLSSQPKHGKSKMENDTQEILALGQMHGRADEAISAVRSGKSLSNFREDILDKANNMPLPNYHPNSAGRSFSIGRAIRSELNGDWNDAGFEKEQIQEAKRNYGGHARGLVIPAEAIYGNLSQRATMVSTGDISGAIGTDLMSDRLIDVNRPVSSVMAAGATVMGGLTQNVDIPKNNNDVSAAFIAENSSITESDIDVDTIQLRPKLCAGTSSFSRQVLVQATPQIDNLVRRNLELQIMNAIDDKALNGDGSGANPTGIASTSNIETFATTGSSTITHDESYDIIAEVAANNLNTTNGTWLVHPTDAATLAGTSKDSGSGTFVYENGRIAGRNVIETTHVTAGQAFFGLFEHCYIGMFGGLDVVVDQFTGARDGKIHITAYQLVDVAVAHAGAFNKVTLTA